MRAEITFDLNLNLQGGIFRLGFAVTDMFDRQYLYCNMNLKQLVMTGNSKSEGMIYLDPGLPVPSEKNEASIPVAHLKMVRDVKTIKESVPGMLRVKLSVVIPTYNRAALLERTLTSLFCVPAASGIGCWCNCGRQQI